MCFHFSCVCREVIRDQLHYYLKERIKPLLDLITADYFGDYFGVAFFQEKIFPVSGGGAALRAMLSLII